MTSVAPHSGDAQKAVLLASYRLQVIKIDGSSDRFTLAAVFWLHMSRLTHRSCVKINN
jgi:hypothetical protein